MKNNRTEYKILKYTKQLKISLNMTLLNTIVYHADSGQIYDKKWPYNTTDKFFNKMGNKGFS